MATRARCRWLLLALLLPLGALCGDAAAGVSARLTQALRRETSTLATLESVTDWLIRTNAELEEVRYRQGKLEHQIAETGRRIKALGERRGQREQHVNLRVRGLYKMSRGGLLRLLLEAPDEHQLSARLSAASLILRRDVREMELYQGELRRLESERARLLSARSEQAALRQKLEAKRAELSKARREQQLLLRKLEQSRRLQQGLTAELDSQQRTLLRTLQSLSWKLRSSGGFAALRTHLPRPVSGPVTSIFGKTVESEHKLSILRWGFTFRPAARAEIKAVADGLVRMSAPLEGYGNLVIVEHADGYFSLYGFLSETKLGEGARVYVGSVLGRAGLDPLTGRSALYFELRHGDRPLDPAAWLKR